MNITVHYTGSAGNLIQAGNILIDPGVPIKKIKDALHYRLRDVRFCLLSHSHADHSKGAKDLMKAGVDIYCSKESADNLKLSSHRLHIIEPGSQINIGPWQIIPFELVHDVSNLGFFIGNGKDRILYATDTNYIHPRFKNLTHILLGIDYDAEILKENIINSVIDPALGKRILKNHMSLKTAIEFFKANDLSRVQGIYIIHLSNTNSNAEMFRQEIQKVTGKPVYV